VRGPRAPNGRGVLARRQRCSSRAQHGTLFLGQTFAIDVVAVDARRHTAAVRDRRSLLAAEPVTRGSSPLGARSSMQVGHMWRWPIYWPVPCWCAPATPSLWDSRLLPAAIREHDAAAYARSGHGLRGFARGSGPSLGLPRLPRLAKGSSSAAAGHRRRTETTGTSGTVAQHLLTPTIVYSQSPVTATTVQPAPPLATAGRTRRPQGRAPAAKPTAARPTAGGVHHRC